MPKKKTNKFSTWKKRKPLERKVADDLVKQHERNEKLRDMRIRDKIKKPQRPVVAYEILPPREKDGTLNAYAETISSLLSQTHIDAINIPEVHDEIGRGERPVSNQERGEPRKFGMLLQDYQSNLITMLCHKCFICVTSFERMI